MRIFLKAVLFIETFLFLFVAFPGRVQALLQGNRVILVDDYNDKDRLNDLGGEGRGEEGFQGTCIPGFVAGEEAWGGDGASLFLDYDVTAQGSFTYFLIPLGVADLTGMSYLSFRMKSEGKQGPSRLEWVIEVHEDTNGDQKYILGQDGVERVLVSPFVRKDGKEGWQKVVIPLSRFRKIRHWDRTLEIVFVFENKWRIGKGRLLVDDLLLGSNYPEGLEGREIPMQNRVSSFKIGGRIASPEMRLKRKSTTLTLTLTFIDPYLEEIRFEGSEDGGSQWQRIRSFYDHSKGGVYETPWELTRLRKRRGILVRAMGVNGLGGETELAGPYHIRLG